MSFFQTGFDNLQTIEKEMEERRAKNNKPWRFWLKPGAETQIIFLSCNEDGSDVPTINEHQLKIDGKWTNWFTCLKNLGQECPLCEAGDNPSIVGFFTIIDRTAYETRKGAKVKDSVKVMAAKFKSLKQFKKYAQKFKGLKGIEFEVERTDNKAASIGDVFFNTGERYDDEALAEIIGQSVDDVLVDWEEFLKPLTASELKAIVSGKANEHDDEDDVDYE